MLSSYNTLKEEDTFKDDQEMVDSSLHKRVVFDASRKHKDGSREKNEIPIKFVKFHVQENVARCGDGGDKLGFNGDSPC